MYRSGMPEKITFCGIVGERGGVVNQTGLVTANPRLHENRNLLLPLAPLIVNLGHLGQAVWGMQFLYIYITFIINTYLCPSTILSSTKASLGKKFTPLIFPRQVIGRQNRDQLWVQKCSLTEAQCVPADHYITMSILFIFHSLSKVIAYVLTTGVGLIDSILEEDL